MSAPADPRLPRIRALAEAYIRGERTDPESKADARGDPELAPLLAKCLGCNSVAQELLEQIGLSPFDTDLPFADALVMTRGGMRRNLEQVRTGNLEPVALCDWVTDAFAWQPPDAETDGVLSEIAGELMAGEDEVEALVRDADGYGLLLHHLDSTPAALSDVAALGLAIHGRHDEWRALIGRWVVDDLDDDGFRAAVARMLHDHRESHPTLVDDLADAAALLRGATDPGRRISSFLRCLAKTADPLTCAEVPTD